MKRLLLLALISLFISSCGGDDDGATTNPFIGNWSGSYIYTSPTGTDLTGGSFTFTVNSDLTVTGSYLENGTDTPFNAQGTINDNGIVSLGIYETGNPSQFGSFSGQLNTNGTASGIWQNLQQTQYSGTWTGNKN